MIRPAGMALLMLFLLLRPFGLLPVAEAAETEIRVDEHPGARVPLDLTFRDEAGRPVRLAELVQGPTVILPVYYRCTNVCAYQMGRMAGTLQAVDRKPVTDYRVISISFDETETAGLAARSRQTYLAAMKGPFPPEGWRFLTGDSTAIRDFTDAIGYRFQRRGADFAHPVASVVIAADGTIIRYLYGISVLPKDLALALTEAKSGIAGVSVRKMMEFCFSYDPAGRGYVFNLLRVSGTVVLVCAGGLLGFLLLGGRKPVSRGDKNNA